MRVSVYPDSESEWPTNGFKQRTSPILPEMPDRWLLTLVNIVFCRVSVNNSAVPYKYYVSERKIISFYEKTNILLRMAILFALHKYICVTRIFHYPDRFLQHLVRKNEGLVY